MTRVSLTRGTTSVSFLSHRTGHLEKPKIEQAKTSFTKQVEAMIQAVEIGQPFTARQLLQRYPHLDKQAKTLNKILSRLVQQKVIMRVTRGVYVRPKISRFVGEVVPDVESVIQVIATERQETIQVHGAEAVRQFHLSTQVPMQPIYYTSGRSRQIKMGNLTIKLVHTSNQSRLQHAGQPSGMALSALWYMGKDSTNMATIEQIYQGLGADEFEILSQSSMPKWMDSMIHRYLEQRIEP